MLKVEQIEAGYGRLKILHGVELTAEEGAITAIIGPNGAGKSTLLKTICGFLRPWAGTIEFENVSLVGLAPEQVLRRGVLYVQQGRSVFPYLTVDENLRMGAYIVRHARRTRDALERAYSTFPRLFDRRQQLAGSLSGGERRFLELARVLMLDPKLVLLDEPSLGVAPKVMAELYERIEKLNAEGISFLIVEQNVNLALQAAAVVYVLEIGRTAWSGPPEELRQTGALRELYLGGHA